MLFAKLQIILELTKDYAVKRIAFQICKGLFTVFFAPVGVRVLGEGYDLAIDFYEGDDGWLQFVEGLHFFLLPHIELFL